MDLNVEYSYNQFLPAHRVESDNAGNFRFNSFCQRKSSPNPPPDTNSDKLPQHPSTEFLLLVYNWVTELVMREAGSLKENSARFHIRDQGRRLEGKVDCEKWDIRRLTVNRALMLSTDPRLESRKKISQLEYQELGQR